MGILNIFASFLTEYNLISKWFIICGLIILVLALMGRIRL